jgi:DNA-directed RNA polymerase subunit M/transcription elongation factor TFIIS
LPDRFVCRREGHAPALVFSKFTASGVEPPTTYMTTCVRCGKWAEFPIPKEGSDA